MGNNFPSESYSHFNKRMTLILRKMQSYIQMLKLPICKKNANYHLQFNFFDYFCQVFLV